MSYVLPNSDVLQKLMAVLGLPKNVKWFQLTAGVDEITELKVHYYPETKDLFRDED